MSKHRVEVFADLERLYDTAARHIAGVLTSLGGEIRIALSGGSTPVHVHRRLAQMDGIDWERVNIYFGDERMVPPDDPESNYRMARETLLDEVPIPADNVFRMHGELNPGSAAAAYQHILAETFNLERHEIPQFDLIILGVGGDGHTASLFPGTKAITERDSLATDNWVPQLDAWRLTLTYPVLDRARSLLVLATGANKAEALRRTFDPNERDKPPVAGIRPDGPMIWMLDEPAAVEIDPEWVETVRIPD